jgi:hypothetical protein
MGTSWLGRHRDRLVIAALALLLLAIFVILAIFG